VPKDVKKGAEWLAKAAEQGDAVAQRFLGSMYMYIRGEGVPKDVKEGVELLIKAAEQGDAAA
jgi:TPR repeat protein